MRHAGKIQMFFPGMQNQPEDTDSLAKYVCPGSANPSGATVHVDFLSDTEDELGDLAENETSNNFKIGMRLSNRRIYRLGLRSGLVG